MVIVQLGNPAHNVGSCMNEFINGPVNVIHGLEGIGCSEVGDDVVLTVFFLLCPAQCVKQSIYRRRFISCEIIRSLERFGAVFLSYLKYLFAVARNQIAADIAGLECFLDSPCNERFPRNHRDVLVRDAF